MMIAKSIKEAYSKKGYKGILRYLAQRLVGFEQLEDQVNTNHYILNHYLDIQKFSNFDENLCNLQKADTLLLLIVDATCKKFGFEYWCDGGTYLGAVRHKGFIPWDDDLDICMMRETYEQARPVLEEFLAQYGIDAVEDKTIGRIGIGYKHVDTGVWLDLLPAEYTTVDVDDVVLKDNFLKRCYKYQLAWRKKQKRLTRDEAFSLRKKYLPEICERKVAKSIIYCPEEGAKQRIWRICDILPTRAIDFEQRKVSAPNSEKEYLVQFYGENYMQFPKVGVEHHGDSKGKLSLWASKSGTDMKAIIVELEDILSTIILENKEYDI